MKIRNTIAVMICIMLLASCCIVAAAASGSENVGGGFWAWETIPGFMAKIVLSASLAKAFSFGSSRRRRNRSRRC